MIYVCVVSLELVGVVAFSLWAAFEEPHCRDRDCGCGSFGLLGNTISVVDPVPNVSCQIYSLVPSPQYAIPARGKRAGNERMGSGDETN